MKRNQSNTSVANNSEYGDEISLDHLVGIFLATKQIVEMCINIIAGPVTDKIGYDIPLLIGYTVVIISSSGEYASNIF